MGYSSISSIQPYLPRLPVQVAHISASHGFALVEFYDIRAAQVWCAGFWMGGLRGFNGNQKKPSNF